MVHVQPEQIQLLRLGDQLVDLFLVGQLEDLLLAVLLELPEQEVLLVGHAQLEQLFQ